MATNEIRDPDLRGLFDHVSSNPIFDRLHRRSPPPLLPFCGSHHSQTSVYNEIMKKEIEENRKLLEKELNKKEHNQPEKEMFL